VNGFINYVYKLELSN